MPVPIEFTEAWIPDKLYVRADAMERVCDLLTKWLHVYIGGPRGSGKTVLCQHAPLHFKTDYSLYVKCSGSYDRSTRAALTLQGKNITRNDNIALVLRQLNSTQLLMFDDIHQIYNFRRGLSYLKSIYDNARTDFRTIVTSIMPFHVFQRECPPEVWSRFQWKPLILNPFNATQLSLILKQRAEKVFKHIDEGAISFISAKVTRLADPRIGLRVLNYAYTLNSESLTINTTDESWNLEKRRYWKDDVLLSLSPHTSLLLLLIAMTAVPWNTYFRTTSREVYAKYEKLCRTHGISPLYQARLNYYFDDLERMGYIKRKTTSFGRRGITSDITLLFDEPSIIVEAGKEIDWETFLV